MRKIRIPAALTAILLFLLLLNKANAQSNSTFKLKDGDKVVFLGNSLFENELQYGYLELALTTRYPGNNITYRNLGWTGDNVWGEGRSTYTNPPTPYEHLMQQITKAQPTVVFVAYGGVESQDGEEGVAKFKDGYNKLLNKIDELGAKSILLSPIPVMYNDTAAHTIKRNANIELYSNVIAGIASERKKQFIDIYKPVQKWAQTNAILDGAVNLNEAGYYLLAQELEKNLGFPARDNQLNVVISKTGATSSAPVKIEPAGDANVRFTIDETILPLPLPADYKKGMGGTRIIKISGLKKGFYTLTADHQQIITASAQSWADGVEIVQGPDFNETKQIQEMIQKKNEQFFFQYRPLNRTYILGFRAYEQGRHAKGLEDQSLIMKWIEGQIMHHSIPKQRIYTLMQLK